MDPIAQYSRLALGVHWLIGRSHLEEMLYFARAYFGIVPFWSGKSRRKISSVKSFLGQIFLIVRFINGCKPPKHISMYNVWWSPWVASPE
jgi:hypothetical protein